MSNTYQTYLTSLTARNYLKNADKLTVVRILDGTYGGASSFVPTGARQVFKLVNEEFKNEPDNLKIALKALEDNNKEYAERAKEDREYNEKVLRNRVPIEESNQRVIQPTPAPDTGAVDTAAQPVAPAVNPASRLAGAFNPTGMMPTPTTGAINPNTMARGSALFGGPREITFAAQGGIMNARKQIQRVA